MLRLFPKKYFLLIRFFRTFFGEKLQMQCKSVISQNSPSLKKAFRIERKKDRLKIKIKPDNFLTKNNIRCLFSDFFPYIACRNH
jgi:hypothetical protein